MSVTEFKINDKDYLEKLNEMSAQAGDVQLAKADAEQALSDAKAVRDVDIPFIKSEMEQIRDVDMANLLNQIIGLRDATNTIAVGDIAGMDVDFNSAKVQGENVVLASEISNMDNTSDLNKPVSTATQNALDEIEIFALAGMVM